MPVIIAKGLYPIPFRTRKSSLSAPMVLCLKTRKSRTLPGISKMKNLIIVTGGAGFVGSNLIKSILKNTNKKIISLDNYSSGSKKNHIKNNRVKYLKAETVDISKRLKNVKKKYIQYFILENLQEFIKALKNLMNVLNQILLDRMQFLSFVYIMISNLFTQQLQLHLEIKGMIKTYLLMLLQNLKI